MHAQIKQLKRTIKKKHINFIRIYNSEWLCSYTSNVVGFKNGSFICHFKKFEDAENYALNRTLPFSHERTKLSFRKTKFIDYIIGE